MTTVDCTREDEVLDGLTTGQWPEHASQELRDHVAACHVCADLVEVASPLLAERGEISEHAHIPSSGVMWWRAQMRARQEAARSAARPITVAQSVALTIGLALTAGLLYTMAPWLRRWMADLPGMPRLDLPTALIADGPIVPISVMVIAGVMLLLMPVAVYFAVRVKEDRG